MSILLEALKKASENERSSQVGTPENASAESKGDSEKSTAVHSALQLKLDDHSDESKTFSESELLETGEMSDAEKAGSAEIADPDPFDAIEIIDDSLKVPEEEEVEKGATLLSAPETGQTAHSIEHPSLEGAVQAGADHIDRSSSFPDKPAGSLAAREADSSVSSLVSRASLDSLNRVGIGYYLRRAVLLLLVPLFFVLVIFYSAVQWYSQLNDEFHARYGLASMTQVIREYEEISREMDQGRTSEGVVGPEQKVAVATAEEAGRGQIVQNPDHAEGAAGVHKVRNERAISDGGQPAKTTTVTESVKRTASELSPNRPESAVHVSKAGSRLSPVHERQTTESAEEMDDAEVGQFVLLESDASRLRTLIEAHQLDQAQRLLDKLLAVTPNNDSASAELFFLAGYLYAQKKEFSKSIEFLQRALDVDPYYMPAAELMAHELVQLNDAKSLESLQILHQRMPGSEVISASLALLLERSGKTDSAIRVLRETFKVNPTADLAYNLASLYAYSGTLDLAAHYVREAVRLAAAKGASFNDQDLADLIEYINHSGR